VIRLSKASGSGSLVCPFCEVGQLERKGSVSAGCISCGKVLSWSILEDLRQLIALPESLGTHACECGPPEMRSLPDGVFHCPACGSEILPQPTGRHETRLAEKLGSSSEIERAAQERRGR
jgi:ribosomal protein L37AE/L43A